MFSIMRVKMWPSKIRDYISSQYRTSSSSSSLKTSGIVNKDIKDSNFGSAHQLLFNNAAEVFGHRTTRELLRAYFVLHVCAVEPLVKRSFFLMRLGKRVLGPTLLSKLMSPFYFQFVAGDSEDRLMEVARVLSEVGVNLMVAPMLETDIGLGSVSEDLYEDNLSKTLELIGMSSRCRMTGNHLRPICQTKITAHVSADILFNIARAYEKLSFAKRRALVESISVTMKRVRDTGSVPQETVFPHLDISEEDLQAFKRSLHRFVKIGELSKAENVILTVDAECTYTNCAISLITLAMMITFNDQLPVVWNTYQGYLKNTKEWLEHDLDLISSFGVSFGVKLVRGAYLELEREYATRNNIQDPVNDTYELTNAQYNRLVNYLVPLVAASPHQFQMIVATHNEASIINTTHQMRSHGIPNSSSDLVFGQIYGMAENISVPLSKGNYSVYKSVPYGNIIEVLPYLSRRANENRAVFRGARRERELLSEELSRRFKRT